MGMNVKAFSFRSVMRSDVGRALRAMLVCVCAWGIAGCDEVGDALDDDDETFHIRSLNLIEDSATIDVLIGDATVASVAYGSGTGFSAAHPGNREITLEAELAPTFDDDDEDDDPMAFGQPVARTFVKDTPYTFIAYGTLANPRTFFVEGADQRGSVANDKVVLQFAHAATSAPQVEVYVLLAEAGVTVPQFVATVNVEEASAPLELTLTRSADELDTDTSLTGDLVVELRAVGSGQALFVTREVSVSEKSRYLFTIADSTAPGPATIKLVNLANGSTEEIFERDDAAALRLVHASAETPTLDVTVGSSFSNPFADSIGFRGVSAYARVEAGDVGMIAVPDGDPSVFVFLEEFTAAAGTDYSAFAIGPLDDVDAVVIAGESRSVPTQSKFRFLHAAASLAEQDPLDIYLRLPGETVDFSDDDTTPTFSSVSYSSATSYLTYKEASYDVYFAYAGTSTIVRGPVSFQTSNGGIDTFVLMDDESGALELMPVSEVR